MFFSCSIINLLYNNFCCLSYVQSRTLHCANPSVSVCLAGFRFRGELFLIVCFLVGCGRIKKHTRDLRPKGSPLSVPSVKQSGYRGFFMSYEDCICLFIASVIIFSTCSWVMPRSTFSASWFCWKVLPVLNPAQKQAMQAEATIINDGQKNSGDISFISLSR